MTRSLAVLMGVFGWLLAASAAFAGDQLNGRYYGIDEAAGASIVINPDPGGYKGTFYDRHGNSQDFEADGVDDAAEAVLDMDGRTVLLRLAPLPYGAQVSLVPFDKDGNLILEASRSLGFIREGIRLPQMPAEFIPAPRSDCQRIAAHSFLVSYQFWEPTGVVAGYLCLPERARTLMRMFPAVQLDVIWKLCLSPGADRALARALRGAGVSCPEVLDAIANTQRTGRFERYKGEVEGERQALKLSIRCADGYLESKSACEQAARTLSMAATSMRTPAMVLRRYR